MTTERLILDALFADDCALMAYPEAFFQPTPLPTITIEGTELRTVEHFKYLGSFISSDGSLDKKISTRIRKASQSIGRLRTRVMNHRIIKKSTKIKVYKPVVLTSLLYGCETWTLYRKHLK
ncbi:hypothetical protein QQF64_013618 [Cirrhinus molitorella]|uniref:Uncharacterized protein n=1 Tax=Cirrhinus molitorella TaxID=172907 RepID=A0ABR3LRP2_9TELE